MRSKIVGARLYQWLTERGGVRFAQRVAEIWGYHRVPRHAAALAFFSLLTLSPLLVVMTGIAGYFLGTERVAEQILKAVEQSIGEGAQRLVQQILEQTLQHGTGVAATLMGLALSLWSASGLLQSLKNSLDELWNSPPHSESEVHPWILTRLIASMGVLILILLISVSLVLELVLNALRQRLTDHPPFGYWLGYGLNRVLFPLIVWLGLTLFYWWLPRRRPRWRVAMWSALVATLLLIMMRSLVSLYLLTTGLATLYGSAGSVVVLLLWTYFSAQAFFLGAIVGIVLSEEVSLRSGQLPHS